MKILMVSSFLPYPLDSGGHVRLYNILKKLQKNNEVTLVCEKRAYQSEKDIEEVKKICKKVIYVPRKKQWSISNILKSGFSQNSFLITGHTSEKLKNLIKQEMQENAFDIIHVETFYVMQNLPETSLPVVLVEHNIEYLVYKRYAQQAPVFLRPLLLLDVKKIERFEKQCWENAKKLVAVSEHEKKMMKRKDVEVVPNGVDTQRFKIYDLRFKNGEKEKTVLFIGNFKWIQNRDSIKWIITEIWPKIKSAHIKLWVVGQEIPGAIKNVTNDPSIVFDENATSDTAEIFKKADVLLAPIRVGGGTSYKILEAMASGVPVVTTKLGIEGLDVVENKEVLVSDNSEGLANLAVTILSDESLYKKITTSARSKIEEKYDWDILVKKLEEVYKSAVA